MTTPARQPRSLLDKLLTIVHVLEVLALAFGALAVWGVTRDWPAPTWFGVVALYLLLTTGLLRYRWGWLASLLGQAALFGLGLIEPVMIAVALVFFGMWVFCVMRARQIEPGGAGSHRPAS